MVIFSTKTVSRILLSAYKNWFTLHTVIKIDIIRR